MKKKIAILGATSHIAKGLILNFTLSERYALYLFARSPGKVSNFLKLNNLGPYCHIHLFKYFQRGNYDVVINCIGIGTPTKLKKVGGKVFELTEEFDNLVLEYLQRHKKALYINFSSGAVYGSVFTRKLDDNSKLSISVNDIKPENYYGIAKLYSEAKHRALEKLRIVDIRVFSYFSRFIDLEAGYFLTELLKSLKKKEKFIANPYDFVRDFISPQDLFNLVCLIIKTKPFNGVIDAYSSMPVSKFKLLNYFSKNYSLKYIFDRDLKLSCTTGTKSLYCSRSRKAAKLGYKPVFSSIKTITMESRYILDAANE